MTARKPTPVQAQALNISIEEALRHNRVKADMVGSGAREDVRQRMFTAGWISSPDTTGQVTEDGFAAVGRLADYHAITRQVTAGDVELSASGRWRRPLVRVEATDVFFPGAPVVHLNPRFSTSVGVVEPESQTSRCIQGTDQLPQVRVHWVGQGTAVWVAAECIDLAMCVDCDEPAVTAGQPANGFPEGGTGPRCGRHAGPRRRLSGLPDDFPRGHQRAGQALAPVVDSETEPEPERVSPDGTEHPVNATGVPGQRPDTAACTWGDDPCSIGARVEWSGGGSTGGDQLPCGDVHWTR